MILTKEAEKEQTLKRKQEQETKEKIRNLPVKEEPQK
jgi:hypothetical protein